MHVLSRGWRPKVSNVTQRHFWITQRHLTSCWHPKVWDVIEVHLDYRWLDVTNRVLCCKEPWEMVTVESAFAANRIQTYFYKKEHGASLTAFVSTLGLRTMPKNTGGKPYFSVSILDFGTFSGSILKYFFSVVTIFHLWCHNSKSVGFHFNVGPQCHFHSLFRAMSFAWCRFASLKDGVLVFFMFIITLYLFIGCRLVCKSLLECRFVHREHGPMSGERGKQRGLDNLLQKALVSLWPAI